VLPSLPKDPIPSYAARLNSYGKPLSSFQLQHGNGLILISSPIGIKGCFRKTKSAGTGHKRSKIHRFMKLAFCRSFLLPIKSSKSPLFFLLFFGCQKPFPTAQKQMPAERLHFLRKNSYDATKRCIDSSYALCCKPSCFPTTSPPMIESFGSTPSLRGAMTHAFPK